MELIEYDQSILNFDVEYHPLSLLFPQMPNDEFEKFKEDISGNGVNNPIYYVIDKDKILILDGRHRYRACTELGIDPFQYMIPFDGPGSDHSFVLSQNLLRRHLTVSQKAMIAVNVMDYYREEAKKRQVEATILGNKTRHDESPVVVSLPQLEINNNSIIESESIEIIEIIEESNQSPIIEQTLTKTQLSFIDVKELNAKNIETKKQGTLPFNESRSSEQVAKQFDIGGKTVRDALVVKDRGTEEQNKAVIDGNASVSSLAKIIREEEKVIAEKPKPKTFITLDKYNENNDLSEIEQHSLSQFNKQENASIDWAKWTWNPVTGCRHLCSYCYARDIANRFYEQKFEPSFYPGRLDLPRNTKVPERAIDDIAYKNVFTCSMADLFGRWVPDEWINQVFLTVYDNPQWNFLFLTKFPKRMINFDHPENAWLGASVDCQARVKSAEDAFENVKSGTKWLSIEPMLEPLKFTRLHLFDWIVIGGASKSNNTPEWTPPFDWVVDLHNQARKAGCKIYHKDNLGFNESMRLKEFPWTESKEKELPESFKYLKGM